MADAVMPRQASFCIFLLDAAQRGPHSPGMDFLTQQELAAFLGVHRDTIRRWSSDGHSVPMAGWRPVQVGKRTRYVHDDPVIMERALAKVRDGK